MLTLTLTVTVTVTLTLPLLLVKIESTSVDVCRKKPKTFRLSNLRIIELPPKHYA